jgi:hypothetical protein
MPTRVPATAFVALLRGRLCGCLIFGVTLALGACATERSVKTLAQATEEAREQLRRKGAEIEPPPPLAIVHTETEIISTNKK